MTDSPAIPQAAIEDFARLDVRAGTIRAARPLAGARNPAYRLEIDFGLRLGIRGSNVQIVAHYGAETLVGRHVIAVVDFPPRRVAGFSSEVLVLELNDTDGARLS